MAHTIVNETLPVVLQEIENVLADYPTYPYQVAFSIEELRQKLIAHVLSQIPNRYSVIEDTQESLRKSKFIKRSLEEQVRLETLVRGSVLHLLRENADWVGHRIFPVI